MKTHITSELSCARGSSASKSDEVGGSPPVQQATSEAASRFPQLRRSTALLFRCQPPRVCSARIVPAPGSTVLYRALLRTRLHHQCARLGLTVAVNALRSVMLTASCAPVKQERSWARTSMRRVSAAGTPTFMSPRNAFQLLGRPTPRLVRSHQRCVQRVTSSAPGEQQYGLTVRVPIHQVLRCSLEVVFLLCAVPPNWVSTRTPRDPAEQQHLLQHNLLQAVPPDLEL